MTYFTEINQRKVRVLDPEDWDGSEYNRPSDKWELIEYIGIKGKDGKPIRGWVPNYTLVWPRFPDQSILIIEEKS